jgi:hypothetical protein
MKKIAFILVALLVGSLIWGLIQSGSVTLTINGEEVTGPFKVVAGGWGFLVAMVTFFCVAILLAFVMAGVGLLVFGALLFAGVIIVAFAFPFLLPILLPLFIVWAFAAGMRRGKKSGRGNTPNLL